MNAENTLKVWNTVIWPGVVITNFEIWMGIKFFWKTHRSSSNEHLSYSFGQHRVQYTQVSIALKPGDKCFIAFCWDKNCDWQETKK